MSDHQPKDDSEEQRRTNRKVLVLTAIVMLLAAAVGIGLARYGGELPIIGPFFDGPGEASYVDGRMLEFRSFGVLFASPGVRS